jgi:hypothetical protein
MKRKPKTNIVTARALTDPDPAFVSLVKGGANQRPYRAVKMESVEATAPHETRKESDMSKTQIVPEGHDIAALKFASKHFADEHAVEAWLKQGGYEGYKIEKTKAGFEVNATDVTFKEGSLTKVDGAVSGLTVYIGELEGETPAEKSEDEQVAEHAEDNTSAVQPVAKKGEAPVADAADEAKVKATVKTSAKTKATADTKVEKADADTNAVEAVAADDEKVDVAKMVEDFIASKKGNYEVSMLSMVLMDLAYLVMDADYMGTDDATVSQIKTAAKTLITALTNEMGNSVAAFEDAFKAIAAKHGVVISEAPAAEADVPPADTATPADEAGVATKSDDAGEGTKDELVVKKDDPLIAAIAGLTNAVAGMKTDMAASLKEINDKVDATKAEINERVEAVETTSQSRKGADVTGDTEEATADAAQKAEGENRKRKVRLASALGHPNPDRV